MAGLTPKQARFVEEYLVDLNATQAAIRAEYSKKTAYSQGQRLLKNVDVAEAIAQALAKRSQRTEITQDMVLRELALIAFSSMKNYMRANTDGDPHLDFTKLTDGQLAALSEVTVEDFKDGRGVNSRDVRRIKFKLYDKRAALVDIGRHLGMFVEKFEDVTKRPRDEALVRAAELLERLGIGGVGFGSGSHAGRTGEEKSGGIHKVH